jgi:hypothetical protein
MVTSSRPDPPSLSTIKATTRRLILNQWNEEWSICTSGCLTREFFPSIQSALTLNKLNPSFEVMQVLSGHSFLNKFLHQIKVQSSPLFSCNQDNETTQHFLFSCMKFSQQRAALIKAVNITPLHWPPNLNKCLCNTILWKAFVAFITQTKRLVKPIR